MPVVRLLGFKSLLLVLGGVLLLSASCSGGSTTPRFDPVQPPTVPSHWLTYSDEAAGFEISHPDDWPVHEIDRRAVEELLEAMQADEPIYGGDFYWSGANPHVFVGILGLSGQTLDTYTELVSDNSIGVAPSWELIQQTRVKVGDQEAVLLLSSADQSDFDPSAGEPRIWELQLAVLTPTKTVWIVSCFTLALTDSEAEDGIATCEAVVRSFSLIAPIQ